MSNKLKLLLALVVAVALLALVMSASREEEGAPTPSATSMSSTSEPDSSKPTAADTPAQTEYQNQDKEASTDESPPGPTALEARQRELEAIYGRAPIMDAELEEAMKNPPPPVLPDNWDEILANPPKLPAEVVKVLNNPPPVQYAPYVERIFREQPEVEIPQGVQDLLEDPTPVPPPPRR